MFALLVAAQVVALAGMTAVSLWGSKHVAPETRIRARAGTSGIDWTMSKTTALLWTPVIGLIVLLATVASGDGPNEVTLGALGLAVMLIVLAAHWSSVKRAAR